MLRRHALLVASLVALPLQAALSPAAAEDSGPVPRGPVAIVEETTANVTTVEPMDLLREGTALALRDDQGVIISYLDTCQRESIRGGEIVIGLGQSEITGGTVVRIAVDCDPAALALTPEQANESATLAFRDPTSTGNDPIAAQAEFVLSTRAPIVIVPDLAEVTIENLRVPGAPRLVQLRDGVGELTGTDGLLDKGGVYRLVGGDRSVVFRISRDATDAALPLLKRAIRF
ncbi:MAG: hypothetical protein JNL25_13860 [Rhodospirillaceae bacterium]|nr:hypothetical protein [Rhodospirillaceae bacterium]